MLRIVYIGILVLFIGFSANAQYNKKSLGLEAYHHHMAYDDHQISFYTLPLDKVVDRISIDRPYHWWGGRQVNVTQGGYSGKLLHGDFNSFYVNKQLKQQGTFKKGLKVGEWREWNEHGKIILRQQYRKGIPQGLFYRYDEFGQLQEEGAYHKGKIQGKLKKYVSPDSISVSRYDKGVLRPEKQRKVWWKRFWKKGSKQR